MFNIKFSAREPTSLLVPMATKRVNISKEAPEETQATEDTDWKNTVSKGGYSVRVAYDKHSTEQSPVMYVETVAEGEKRYYRVDLRSVDPRNATKIEMLALATHKYKNSDARLARLSRMIFESGSPEEGGLSKFDFEGRTDFIELLKKIPFSDGGQGDSLAESPSMEHQEEKKKNYQTLALFLTFLQESPRTWVF